MASPTDPADTAGGPGVHLEQLERAMAVLESFDREHPALTLSEVAQLTGISRAGARRILLTLRSLGYVRSDGRDFSLAPRILNLGWNYFAAMGLDEVARPLMAEVVAEVDESCSMATLDLPDIVYMARVHTKRIMTVSGGVGSRLPAHATALGHVLIAALDEASLERYLAGGPLQPHTPRTVTDSGEFREQLAAVREQGWALVDQELEIGLRAVAVPITGPGGVVSAALSISSNSARVTLSDLRKRCLPPLLEAAATISATVAKTRGHEG
ncbi:IclR family transcriptional regulator C-terminal domain-containing protein [Nocardia sp. NPDC050378]|uniref:IclR family transcriptional regulator domain-containing protein n=1 Tax=Nocardia sp. NPDC050378 TaxID=3155400 RepID=UPI0034084DA6